MKKFVKGSLLFSLGMTTGIVVATICKPLRKKIVKIGDEVEKKVEEAKAKEGKGDEEPKPEEPEDTTAKDKSEKD